MLTLCPNVVNCTPCGDLPIFNITAEDPDFCLNIVTLELPLYTVGEFYSFQMLAEGGGGDYRWTLVRGAFAPGLSMSSDGLISGIPTAEQITRSRPVIRVIDLGTPPASCCFTTFFASPQPPPLAGRLIEEYFSNGPL